MQDILGEGPGEAAGQEPAQVEGESFGTELGQDGHIWNVHYKYSVPGSLGEEFAKIRFKQPHVSNWVGQYFGLIDELAIFFDGPSRVPDLPNHRLVEVNIMDRVELLAVEIVHITATSLDSGSLAVDFFAATTDDTD